MLLLIFFKYIYFFNTGKLIVVFYKALLIIFQPLWHLGEGSHMLAVVGPEQALFSQTPSIP